jgi:hypothetical protein
VKMASVGMAATDGNAALLIEDGLNQPGVLASLSPAPNQDGSIAAGAVSLLATIPPRAGAKGERRFRVVLESGRQAATVFRFGDVGDKSLGLWEGQRPVLVYNHGVMSKAGVPADRNRSSYVHPIYGLDGEVLTDDFPKDHYHHRGLFWAWPHVRIGDEEFDLWLLKGIEHRFEKWLTKTASAAAAVLSVENGWYVGDRKVVQERVWLRVFPAARDGQILEVELFWIPLDRPMTLIGAESKSYGGLTLRYAPFTNSIITTPLGTGEKDLTMTHLPWADFSARFGKASRPSGMAIFVSPDHPDFPPMWLTRHYGALCLGWPGVEPNTFPANVPIRCRYQVWIHRDTPQSAALEDIFRRFELALKAVVN